MFFRTNLQALRNKNSSSHHSDRHLRQSEIDLSDDEAKVKSASAPEISQSANPQTLFKAHLLKTGDCLYTIAAANQIRVKPYPDINCGDILTIHYHNACKSGAVYISITHTENAFFMPTFLIRNLLSSIQIDTIYLDMISRMKAAPDLLLYLIYDTKVRSSINPTSIAKLFAARGGLNWLLALMTKYECEKDKDTNTIFRDRNCSVLLDVILNMIIPANNFSAKQYVAQIVASLMKKRAKYKTLSNKEIIELASSVILEMRAASTMLPDEIVYVFKSIKPILCAFWGTEKVCQILGGILMLRIIVPAIVEHKNLLEVGKKLQALSNQTISQHHELTACEDMMQLLHFIAERDCIAAPFASNDPMFSEAQRLHHSLCDIRQHLPDHLQQSLTNVLADLGDNRDLMDEKIEALRSILGSPLQQVKHSPPSSFVQP